ncbi:YKL100C [Saccharomyces arboricola H-6]|uniref:YKL100C n=1 Tax=Saccharomyces arboricola (strain H-6 / AS 2.3317 / CBS 10644) TaxID=1160507 RepID=J8LLK7_SACAR|nr:YKL100C [Saccharomyces arboricola H-6]
MDKYIDSVVDYFSEWSSRVFRANSTGAGQASSNKELEQVFEKINAIVENHNNNLATTFDKISYRVAHKITQLVESHSLVFNYATLVLIASYLVVIGSFASISSIPFTALPPTKEHPLFDPTDFDVDHDCHVIYHDDDEDKKKKKNSKRFYDMMDEKHAIILPLTSGCTLLALYFVIKKLHLNWLKYVVKTLNFNITLLNIPAGTFVYSYILNSFFRNVSHLASWNPLVVLPRYRLTIADDNEDLNKIGGFVTNLNYKDGLKNSLVHKKTLNEIEEDHWMKHFYRRELIEPKDIKSKRQISNLYLNNALIVSFVLSIVSTLYFYFSPNNWLISNIVSMNMAIWSISQLKLRNLKSGALILIALFFYDIYFVFGTDVMVTVATNLDIPVKLSLPVKFNTAQNNFNFSMLGLGDIALPGMFIAMCYKYDIWKWHLDHDDTEFHFLNWSYVGKYFITAIFSYVVSLVAAMVSLSVFNTAQPALLYIVPSLLISTMFVACWNKDFKQFWNFQYDTIETDKSLKNAIEKKQGSMTYSTFILSEYYDNAEKYALLVDDVTEKIEEDEDFVQDENSYDTSEEELSEDLSDDDSS